MLSGTAPVAQDDLYTVAPNDTLEVLQTTTVAECGFNDASGIHSDATADSPYELGATIHGRSSAEADWSTTWTVSAGGGIGGWEYATAEADSSLEGDGALHAFPDPTMKETWLWRKWSTAQSTPFIIEQWVRLPSGGFLASRPALSTSPQPMCIGPEWLASGGYFKAGDGDGAGSLTWENTGIAIRTDEWQKVAMLVDPVTRTFELYVDDQPYVSPDPLNFRGNPSVITMIDYLVDAEAWIDQLRVRAIDQTTPMGAMANDTDAEGDALTASLVSSPAHGTVKLLANGSFLYAPVADYTGTDTFTYKLNDGTSDSNVATVTIRVGTDNELPVAEAGGPYTVLAGESVALSATGSYDPDGGVRPDEWDLDYDGVTFDVDATGATPTFSAGSLPAGTTQSLGLRVTDYADAVSVVDTATVRVVELTPPTVTDVELSDSLLSKADVGDGTFTVTVTFDEAMQTTTLPTIAFTPDVRSTLTLADGAWTDATHYTATYNVANTDVTVADVEIEVSGALDLSGNSQVVYTAPQQFSIDTAMPFVTDVTSNYALVNDSLAGEGTFSLTIDYNEATGMDAGVLPTVSFVGQGDLSGTLVFRDSTWLSSTSLLMRYDVVDQNLDAGGVNVLVSGAQDLAGNTQVAYISFVAFRLDMENPVVQSLTPSLTTIGDGDAGEGKFTIAVTYSEAMNVPKTPTISFAPDVARVLTLAGSSWVDSVYTAIYDVRDANVNLTGVDITVSGVEDAAGNPQVASSLEDALSILTQGATTLGVFDPATSTFSLRTSNTSGEADYTFGYGTPDAGWVTLVGDWDGDGASGVGLYASETSTFYLTSTFATGTAEYTFGYGVPDAGWVPLVGDWNGDGRTGVGLYDPQHSTFYLTDTLESGYAEYTFGYGVPDGGWTALVGDWDGNGTTGVGLFDPADSTFYLTNTLESGAAEHTFGYGVPHAGWQPLVGDWSGNGADGVGLFATDSSTFYLTSTFVTGTAEYTFGYGVPNAGWRPLVGDWNGNGGDGVGLYDATSSTFYLTNTLAVGTAEITVEFGQPQRDLLPLVGTWTATANATSPAALDAAAVDQLDLANLAADELLTSKI